MNLVFQIFAVIISIVLVGVFGYLAYLQITIWLLDFKIKKDKEKEKRIPVTRVYGSVIDKRISAVEDPKNSEITDAYYLLIKFGNGTQQEFRVTPGKYALSGLGEKMAIDQVGSQTVRVERVRAIKKKGKKHAARRSQRVRISHTTYTTNHYYHHEYYGTPVAAGYAATQFDDSYEDDMNDLDNYEEADNYDDYDDYNDNRDDYSSDNSEDSASSDSIDSSGGSDSSE